MNDRPFDKVSPEILALFLKSLQTKNPEKDKQASIGQFNIFPSNKDKENQNFYEYFKNEENIEYKKAFLNNTKKSKEMIQSDVKSIFEKYKNKIAENKIDDLKIKNKILFYRLFTDLNGDINQNNYESAINSFRNYLSNFKYRIVFCLEQNSVLKGAINQYKNNNYKDFTFNKRVDAGNNLFYDIHEIQNQIQETDRFVSIFVFPENFFENDSYINKTTYYNSVTNTVSHHVYHIDTRYRMFTFQINQSHVFDINQERYPEIDVAFTKNLNQTIDEKMVKEFLEQVNDRLDISCRIVN